MESRLVLPETFVVFDTETSGMHPADGHSIIELAAQKIRGREVVAEFVTLVNPGHALDPEAAAVHGISEIELLASGKKPEEVFPSFVQFISDLPLVAHNVDFDVGFLNEHHRRLKLVPLSNRLIDTIAIAKQLLILPSYSLESVARFLKIPQPEAHRALADVNTLRAVLFKLMERAAVKGVGERR